MLAAVGFSDWLLLFLFPFLCHPEGYQKYHTQAQLLTLTTRKGDLLHAEEESQGPSGYLQFEHMECINFHIILFCLEEDSEKPTWQTSKIRLYY